MRPQGGQASGVWTVEMHELSKLVPAKQQLVHASPRALASSMSTLALEGGFFSSSAVPASEATTRGNSHGEIVWSQDLSPRYHIPP